jgi:hypothetical protein
MLWDLFQLLVRIVQRQHVPAYDLNHDGRVDGRDMGAGARQLNHRCDDLPPRRGG